jgi:hypothetical protein
MKVCKKSESGGRKYPMEKDHLCTQCGKGCVSKWNLQKHILTQHTNENKKAVTIKRYNKDLKEEVAIFAVNNSVEEAIKKFNVPDGTVRRWVKVLTNPQTCEECGAALATGTELRRHIQVNHESVPYLRGKPKYCPNLTSLQKVYQENSRENVNIKGLMNDKIDTGMMHNETVKMTNIASISKTNNDTPKNMASAETPNSMTSEETPKSITSVETPKSMTIEETPKSMTIEETPKSMTSDETAIIMTSDGTSILIKSDETPRSETTNEIPMITKNNQTKVIASADTTVTLKSSKIGKDDKLQVLNVHGRELKESIMDEDPCIKIKEEEFDETSVPQNIYRFLTVSSPSAQDLQPVPIIEELKVTVKGQADIESKPSAEYPCENCDKVFRHKCDVERHQISHTKIYVRNVANILHIKTMLKDIT